MGGARSWCADDDVLDTTADDDGAHSAGQSIRVHNGRPRLPPASVLCAKCMLTAFHLFHMAFLLPSRPGLPSLPPPPPLRPSSSRPCSPILSCSEKWC